MKKRLIVAILLAAAVSAPALAAVPQEVKERAKPGDAHKALAQLAGRWDFTTKTWGDPKASPEVNTGTCVNTMVLGGRFLRQDVTGTKTGGTFEGTRLTGYDNVRGEYQTFTFTDLATNLSFITGSYDAAKKTFTFSGSSSSAATGQKDRPVRTETTLIDKDNHSFRAYFTGPGGQEYKAVETLYTRSKK